MRAFISLLLIVVLTTCALCEDCDEGLVCPPNAPEVCVLHSDLYCFTKYENLCVWNEVKCKYNLKFQIYAPEYCELENFACLQTEY